MCVIIVCEKKKPELETLITCEKTNADGGGIAWKKDDVIEYKKGLTAKEVFLLSQEKPLPQVIHFRLASIGGRKRELCHPFPVNKNVPLSLEGEAKKVLFHNGHWSRWREYCLETAIRGREKIPEGKWSDSRAIAWLTAIYGMGFLELLDEKVVCFSSHKTLLFGEGWIEKDGITFSNILWDVRGKYYWNHPKYW